jgi:short-subunit dehydrogenase
MAPKNGTDSSRVVVITGASSGIGRASSLAFARKGDHVVLAARREQALKEAARECELSGARSTLVVPTDVTNEEAVVHLASQTMERYGKIDVWVNNAAVSLFGQFEETPTEPYRRVIETNFFGYVHGARASIRHFREQGHGTLINVSSMVARLGQPYTSAYVSSKAAISALSECLRMELMDAPNIEVCTLLPASIDTPIFRQAANYTGRAAKPMNPVYDPEMVADDIVSLADNPRREHLTGGFARIGSVMHTLSPGMYERNAAVSVAKDHFADDIVPPSPGNLFEPMPQWAKVSGGYQGRRLTKGPRLAMTGAGIGMAGLLAWGLVQWVRK